MQAKQAPGLRRTQVREILKRHPGSISRLAAELGITVQSVSLWLRGKHASQRVERAAQKKAQELLESERAAA